MTNEFRKEKIEELVKEIYDKFQKYFISGDIIISGSLFYRKIGYPEPMSYNDIDLIIIDEKDDIFYEIINYFDNGINIIKTEITDRVLGYPQLIGSIKTEYIYIDLFRNNFKKNKSSIEIIPGVITNYHSNEAFVDIYTKFVITIKFYFVW